MAVVQVVRVELTDTVFEATSNRNVRCTVALRPRLSLPNSKGQAVSGDGLNFFETQPRLSEPICDFCNNIGHNRNKPNLDDLL